MSRTLLPSAETPDTTTSRVNRELAERDLQEKSYMPKEFILCTLPHSNPRSVIWNRRNGNYALNVEAGYDANGKPLGIPYGSIPRLLLCWVTNEAIATKSRHIKLGKSLAEFLADIGLSNKGGGKRSSRRALERQILSLCYCKMRFIYQEGNQQKGHEKMRGLSVTDEHEFWWDYTSASQTSFFDSYLMLSQQFFDIIMASPVPLSTQALGAIKKSPLAIDLYAMASHRLFTMMEKGRPVDTIPMPALRTAFGSEYTRNDHFKAALSRALRLIKDKAWPMLNYEVTDRGLMLATSPLTVARQRKTRQLMPGQKSQAELIHQILTTRRMDETTMAKAKALAPKWDTKALESVFWEWTTSNKITVKDPRPLFLSFVQTHDKLNRA